jgi:hypothetical protein
VQSKFQVANDIGELRLLASSCADGGRVVVTQSDLSAPSVVLIAAGATSSYHGCAGRNGTVQVAQSSIAGSNPKYGVVQIYTGQDGATSASQNTFAGVSAVWSAGGSCKSMANLPETPCS